MGGICKTANSNGLTRLLVVFMGLIYAVQLRETGLAYTCRKLFTRIVVADITSMTMREGAHSGS